MEKVFNAENYLIKYTSTANNNDYYESHCHTNYEIIFIISGNVDLIIEEKKYTVDKPCVVFFLPTVYHSVFPNKNSIYERITCQFPKTYIPNAIYNRFENFIKENPVVSSDEIIKIQSKLNDVIINKDVTEYSSYISALICELFYVSIDSATQNLSYKPNTTISSIIGYINANLDKIITLDDIAKALYISPSTISHIFKKHLNTSVKQYILQKKMLLAQKYFDSGISAIEVSRTLGYNNYSNFCNIYKKIVKKYPKQK